MVVQFMFPYSSGYNITVFLGLVSIPFIVMIVENG